MDGDSADTARFIAAHTAPSHAPLVGEIVLRLATEITPIWQASEDWLARAGVAPPFWAFAWPGGQALARHVLDGHLPVGGRRVLDFASGCGLAAIACAQRQAASVEASEIDPLAIAAIGINARANGVDVIALPDDIVGAACRWDVILCGDVCYERPMTRHIMPWLRRMAETAEVIVADPGRDYRPGQGMVALAAYDVPTSRELEDRDQRRTVLYRVEPHAEAAR